MPTSGLIDLREYREKPEYQHIYQEMEQIIGDMQSLPGRLMLAVLGKKKIVLPIWSKRWELPWAILSANLQSGMRVLDAGCGASPMLPYLARRGYRCFGVDKGIDPSDLNWKGRILRRVGVRLQGDFYEEMGSRGGDVFCSKESVEDLSFADGFFDCVFCISALRHIPPKDQSKAMQETARVLTTGGTLFVTVDICTENDRARAKRLPSEWYPFLEYCDDFLQVTPTREEV